VRLFYMGNYTHSAESSANGSHSLCLSYRAAANVVLAKAVFSLYLNLYVQI
jgi:hypothetical protein